MTVFNWYHNCVWQMIVMSYDNCAWKMIVVSYDSCALEIIVVMLFDNYTQDHPIGTWCWGNTVSMSMQHHKIALTLIQYCINVVLIVQRHYLMSESISAMKYNFSWRVDDIFYTNYVFRYIYLFICSLYLDCDDFIS